MSNDDTAYRDGFSRRLFLRHSYLGLGWLSLLNLLADEAQASNSPVNATASKPQHHPAKAKSCIFIFMEGGVSQMDLFENKPAIGEYAWKPLPSSVRTEGEVASFASAPNRVVPPPYKLVQNGKSGRWLSELLPNLAHQVDDLAFIHGIKVDNNNHGPAVCHALTGHTFPGSPSVGAWVLYGLGTETRNLPGYIVLGDRHGPPIVGPSVWGSGYLPATYEGTLFRPGDVPIVNLRPPAGTSDADQRGELELLQWFNRQHSEARTNTTELDARIASYELAFRMQKDAPELVDLSAETAATRGLYGLDDEVTSDFGRQCLLARRMVERGVRFVMLLHGSGNGGSNWDTHSDIKGRLPDLCREVDRPVAGLLADLKGRGLLDETLVVWASEMGRTSFENNLVSEKPGRDHNQYGLVVWMAGGDVRPGSTFGETDDFGLRNVAEPIPLRDVHATLLHLLGLDQNRLTVLHSGRYRKLTDIGGRVIKEVLV